MLSLENIHIYNLSFLVNVACIIFLENVCLLCDFINNYHRIYIVYAVKCHGQFNITSDAAI